jgi:hypothetical protein
MIERCAFGSPNGSKGESGRLGDGGDGMGSSSLGRMKARWYLLFSTEIDVSFITASFLFFVEKTDR